MHVKPGIARRDRVEDFQRRHHIGLVTLLFTDIVGSTDLKQRRGDTKAVALILEHHEIVRSLLRQFAEGEEIETAGDSFFIVFARPSEAVVFSLLLQDKLRRLADDGTCPLQDRIGIHVGEVFIAEENSAESSKRLYGMQVDICARVMSMAQGGQILMTRFAFDNARQMLRGADFQAVQEANRSEEDAAFPDLKWLNHGLYLLKGLEEPLEICEVRSGEQAPISALPSSDKAQRYVSADAEPVLGWRPALEQAVPNSKWILEKKLGEGGFGEVWLGRHEMLKARRVFKFCFRADRVRSLKREVTLFRLLKERIGQHPNIVGIQEVFFDEPPFYIMMDYTEGQDLRGWCEAQGGADKVPLGKRLEITAQVADALQAAHEAGIVHRDVKASNILVAGASGLQVKLTDFGIGQVISNEALAGLTRLGFTQTQLGSSSSSGAGTHMYMAPELLAGKAATHQSDIYSLGVVLYQLLIGDLAQPLTTDWVRKITDPLLRQVLEKCFAGDPKERFAHGAELAKNLRSLEERQANLLARQRAQDRGRVRRAAYGAIALMAILGTVFWFWLGRGNRYRQANDFYEQGDFYFRDRLDTNADLAIAAFGEAIKANPKYAKAYAALAEAYLRKDLNLEPNRGWDRRALEAVQMALSLDSELPEALTVRAQLFFTPAKNWDAERAIPDLRKAVRLKPSLDGAYMQLGFIYNHQGFLDESVRELDKAINLRKDSWLAQIVRAQSLAYTLTRTNLEAAVRIYNMVPAAGFPHPRFQAAWPALPLFYLGRMVEASDLLAPMSELDPDEPLTSSMRAMLSAAAGDREGAERAIAAARKGERGFIHFHHAAYHIGVAYALLNNNEQALYFLKMAADNGFPCYPYFRDDPHLKKLWTNSSEAGAFLDEQRKDWERRRELLLK